MQRRSPLPSPLSALRAWAPLLVPLLLASCAKEDAAVIPPQLDAGGSCVVGSQGCSCDEANACNRGLLCSSSRCLVTEGSGGREPEVRVPSVPPSLPMPPAPELDASAASATPPSTLDAATPASCDGGACDAGPAPSN